MGDRDIDFLVTLPEGGALSYALRAQIMQRLIDIPSLRSIQMSDIHHFPVGAKHAIDGIWFGPGIVSSVTAERWNIDIWFVAQAGARESDDVLTRRLRNLNEDERATIVTLKQAALDAGAKQKGMTSVQIYRAVLYDGFQTYGEFLEYQANR